MHPEINVADVITAAAGSTLGVLSLIAVLIAGLAYSFFGTAREGVRVTMFVLLLIAAIAFGMAIIKSATPKGSESTAPDDGSPSGKMRADPGSSAVVPDLLENTEDQKTSFEAQQNRKSKEAKTKDAESAVINGAQSRPDDNVERKGSNSIEKSTTERISEPTRTPSKELREDRTAKPKQILSEELPTFKWSSAIFRGSSQSGALGGRGGNAFELVLSINNQTFFGNGTSSGRRFSTSGTLTHDVDGRRSPMNCNGIFTSQHNVSISCRGEGIFLDNSKYTLR